MSAAAPQPPIVPPRPARSQERPQMPVIPPRPQNRRLARSSSPNRDRFAPSPLNENPLKSPSNPRSSLLGAFADGSQDALDRSASVDLPSLGEEGMEYAVVSEGLESSRERSVSPEQTCNVGEDLKLHAPKPSLPAISAKQRVATVTRTDSDRAASFGIGKPSSEEPASSGRSLKKKASTLSQLSATDSHMDDGHGIPEIGKQVPMYPNAGDVQAPSPAPGANDSLKPKHHTRKTSARGFTSEPPPGSYGLHGHGVKSQDKLERAYYEKHPELAHKEHHQHHHDRANDFSMSRDELNKIVRDTASKRLSGIDHGTPSEQVGWEAIEESTSRIASPIPPSGPSSPILKRGNVSSPEDNVINVGNPKRRSGNYGELLSPNLDKGSDEKQYTTPILADDEVSKDIYSFDLQPAVSPGPERSGSAFEMEPSTRPKSRPTSIYRESSHDIRSTPLEDVQEYEPLFPEDEKTPKEEAKPSKKAEDKKQRFPSRDIWEDAPDSVHETAEVSTPDVPDKANEDEEEPYVAPKDAPNRETDTPAQAFARRQEELAEAESKENPDAFLHRSQKPAWVQGHPQVAKEVVRPKAGPRFPSRDVWEDTPDSQLLETTVSEEQDDEEPSSPVDLVNETELPPQSTAKPVVPERPMSKQASGDAVTLAKPTIPERPRPQVPARPTRQLSSSSKQGETDASAPKAKPLATGRPMGGKIAALQAGFMADLNKRLQIGPQAPKVEEPSPQEELTVAQEKAPLVDARKSRARGPQRRAPAKSPAPTTAPVASAEKGQSLVLSFSSTLTFFSIDPEEGALSAGSVDATDASAPVSKLEVVEEAAKVEDAAKVEEGPKVENTEASGSEDESTKEINTPASDQQSEAPKAETLATHLASEALVEASVEPSEKKVEPVSADVQTN